MSDSVFSSGAGKAVIYYAAAGGSCQRVKRRAAAALALAALAHGAASPQAKTHQFRSTDKNTSPGRVMVANYGPGPNRVEVCRESYKYQ